MTKTTSELAIGDRVKAAEGAYGTATVRAVYPDRVTLFRPYVILHGASGGDPLTYFAKGDGLQAIAAVAIEQFDVSKQDNSRVWEVQS